MVETLNTAQSTYTTTTTIMTSLIQQKLIQYLKVNLDSQEDGPPHVSRIYNSYCLIVTLAASVNHIFYGHS